MSNTSTESVWIKNPAGVKVALPPSLAAERLKQVGYTLCDPEKVPEQKRYPLDGELTEEGEKRRAHRQEREVKPLVAKETEPSTPTPAQVAAFLGTQDSTNLSPAQYRALNWQELKKYAGLRGIDTMQAGMTKEVVIKLLDEGVAKMQG